MKKGKNVIKDILDRVLGMKLRYQMLLLYIVGGALPFTLIGIYLVNGTNQILAEQAKNTEISEMSIIRRQVMELLNTVNVVSKYFIFDEKLEKISSTQYDDYQELVDDYKDYTAFTEYGSYYNTTISWFSVYMKNDTIRGNYRFVKVDEAIEQQQWYQKVIEKGGSAAWQYIPVSTHQYEGLALTRLLRTTKGDPVGVLVLHVRPERLTEILIDRKYDTMIILNGEEVVAERSDNQITYDQIKEFLPERVRMTYQETVTIDKEAYVMTCININPKETGDYIQLVSFRSQRDILREADKQNQKSVIFFFCSIGASLVMLVLFSWSFSSRVDRFRKQMQKAAAGNFELEKKLGGNDEISELYDYLSTMIWNIQRLLSEIYQEKLHAERLNSERKDMEFKMLVSQINPHFLYNTLETIRMKARVNKQYEIEELVKMLAKILRRSIQTGSQDVTIQSELDLIRSYLKIQQYRFGDRIQYEMKVDPELENNKILPLIMQPLVENSIVHGLELKEETGHIYILVEQKGENILIVVEDDGLGMESEQLLQLQKDMNKSDHDRTHIGVSNVHQRIRLRFGEEYGLKISSSPNHGTRIEILLPKEANTGENENV